MAKRKGPQEQAKKGLSPCEHNARYSSAGIGFADRIAVVAGGKEVPPEEFPPPLRSDSDIFCSLCGADLSQMLFEAGVQPFRFGPDDRERLEQLLVSARDAIPALELQIRAYNFEQEELGPWGLRGRMRKLYGPEGAPERKRRRVKNKKLLEHFCAAAARFRGALRDLGEDTAQRHFTIGRFILDAKAGRMPQFKAPHEADWIAWLHDFGAIQEGALESLQHKLTPGTRRDRSRAILKHRLARVIEGATGRATNDAAETFFIAVKTATDYELGDPQRALTRALEAPGLSLARSRSSSRASTKRRHS